jgi:hypothetical protein
LLAGAMNVQELATKCDEIFREMEKKWLLTAGLLDNDLTASIYLIFLYLMTL